MALVNIVDLQDSIAAWLNRSDFDSALTVDFIRLAEVRIATDFKSQFLIVETTITTDAASKALPTNNKGVISAYLNSDPKTPLDYMPPDEFDSRYSSSQTGKPLAYTIKGQTIYFAPSPDSSYSCVLSHYETPDLNSDITNALFTNYPNLYLFASLVEGSAYIQEDSTMWEIKYQQALQAAQEESDYLGPLAIQLRDAP